MPADDAGDACSIAAMALLAEKAAMQRRVACNTVIGTRTAAVPLVAVKQNAPAQLDALHTSAAQAVDASQPTGIPQRPQTHCWSSAPDSRGSSRS